LSANLKLRFFAKLREDLGTPAEDLILPVGVTTVGDLRAHLTARGGAWATALAPGRALGIAVNQEKAQPSTSIKADDEIAFFPPVTGG